MKNRFKNTPKEGKFRHIVFKDGDTWYAVALEFNIVEASDDPRLAYFSLLVAADGYIASVKKLKGTMDFSTLNQKTDPEYEDLWTNLHSNKPVKSPYQINAFGTSTVNA